MISGYVPQPIPIVIPVSDCHYDCGGDISWWWLIGYIAIGVVCGIIAMIAYNVLGDPAMTEAADLVVVGFFVFIAWPLAIAALPFWALAHRLTDRRDRPERPKRPKRP